MERLLSGELEQFAELADHFGVTAVFEARGHTRPLVPLQVRALEGFDGALDGVGLLEDIHAVDVVLDHLANTAQVALDGGQAIQDLLLVGLHCYSRPRWEGAAWTIPSSERVRQPPPTRDGLARRLAGAKD